MVLTWTVKRIVEKRIVDSGMLYKGLSDATTPDGDIVYSDVVTWHDPKWMAPETVALKNAFNRERREQAMEKLRVEKEEKLRVRNLALQKAKEKQVKVCI